MTHPRPYQAARTSEEALAELDRCAGTQFDPEVVRAFAIEFAGATHDHRRPDAAHSGSAADA